MEQKSFTLINKGMNRDLSISKVGESNAYENLNIRIEARDNDTLFSVTNERGTAIVDNLSFEGELIGWNVLNQYIILFTVKIEDGKNVSRIYRVTYDNGEFKSTLIFAGDLGFSADNPIESVVDYETENIQKIYWVDCINVLRFLIFSDDYLNKHLTSGELDNPDDPAVFTFSEDNTWFDSTRQANGIPVATITKDNTSGITRHNGVAQYFVSYYNKHGQQTGIVYSSPLVYLSPMDRGGAQDETNNNYITLSLSGLDTQYEYVRLYQIIRTSLDGSVVAYLVAEQKVSDNVKFVDDGTNLGTVDATSFLFFGSQEVKATTLAHKDNVLFLGNFESVGNNSIGQIQEKIEESAFILHGESFEEGKDWESAIVDFVYSSSKDITKDDSNIPYVYANGLYPYSNQLQYDNSKITTFKGGEKYRFALCFYRSNGTSTKAFWIGDKVNPFYPRMNNNNTIARAIARCIMPESIIEEAKKNGFENVRLMVARATNSDRSVLAQGIVSPTVFNLFERYSGRAFVQSSWIYRAKNGKFPFYHFQSMNNPKSQYAELQCSFSGDQSVSPLYTIKNNGTIANKPYGYDEYAYINIDAIIYADCFIDNTWVDLATYWGTISIKYYETQGAAQPAKTYTYNLGKTSPSGNGNINKFIEDWNRAYENALVPDARKLTSEQIRERCVTALRYSYVGHTGSNSYALSQTPVAVDFLSRDVNYLYSLYNRQHYFVDESIVTLNSPEIEYEDVNLDKMSGLNFRIVGVARMTSNTTDYVIETENRKYHGDNVNSIDFSKSNIADNPDGLGAWPLYAENYSSSDGNPVHHMIYMWHKSGSIPSYYDEDGTPFSILKSKNFSNLRFSFYTVYNNYGINPWIVKPEDVRQISDFSNRLYELKIGGEKKVYSSGGNNLVTMPGDIKYPVYYTKTAVLPGEDYTLLHTTDNDSFDPVQISYSSRPHAIISFPNNLILPYLDKEQSNTGYTYAPWKNASLNSQTLLYRDVDYSDAEKVADITEGKIGPFEMLSISSSQGKLTARADLRNTGGDVLARELSDMLDVFKNKGVSKVVYAHVEEDDQDNTIRLVDVSDLMLSENSVSCEWFTTQKVDGYVHKGYIVINVYSSIKLKSLYCCVTAVDRLDVSHVIFQEDIDVSKGRHGTATKEFVVDDYVEITVSYSGEYDVSQINNDPIVPNFSYNDIEISFTDKVEESHCDWAVVENASYIEFDDLDDNSVFVDIAGSSSNNILTYTGSEFVYSGIYSDAYGKISVSKYIIPSNDFIKQTDECLFIGELYKDYDTQAKSDPASDLRYGGIMKSAIDTNVFIAAGAKHSLDERVDIESYAKTTVSIQDLYDFIVTANDLVDRDYKAIIGFSGEADNEIITLSSLNKMSGEALLPTTDNPATFNVVYDEQNDEWVSTLENVSQGFINKIASDSNYKVVLLRRGYARRGKWREYKNKYGYKQTSHTTRKSNSKSDNFRKYRVGYSNGLPPMRLRVIGYDLLITKHLSWVEAHSSTFINGGGAIYNDSTLVTSLGDALVLPQIPRKRCVTSKGHISNRAKDGLTDIYACLYHYEKDEWRAVSNPVQVRGRNKTCTKLWEFDKENYVIDLENE